MKGKQHNASISSESVIYAFAHTETWLECYARSHQLPVHELTGRVAALLLAQTGGPVLGAEHNLPALRQPSTQGNPAARQVAVAKRTHRKAQVKRAPCPHCGRKFMVNRGGLTRHIFWMHKQQKERAA